MLSDGKLEQPGDEPLLDCDVVFPNVAYWLCRKFFCGKGQAMPGATRVLAQRSTFGPRTVRLPKVRVHKLQHFITTAVLDGAHHIEAENFR